MTAAAIDLTQQRKCYSYRTGEEEDGGGGKANERSNKTGKINRSVKVHAGEVKQSSFERRTKEWWLEAEGGGQRGRENRGKTM